MKRQLLLLVIIVILGFFLRFIDVSNDPPGLYIDEASIGYNAYTILTTGKDQYGIPYPFWFRSFGDYKMPVYIYLVAGTMAMVGKTELAVRLPSVIAGTLTIPVFYFFLQELLELETNIAIKKKLRYLPVLASFLLAISTWHLQFSRGGFEVTVGTLFYLLGCYFFLVFKKNHTIKSIIFCILSFIITLYTYDTFRVLSPLSLLFIAWEEKVYRNKKSLYIIIPAIILSLPYILFSLTSEGNQRFLATSAFSDHGINNIFSQILVFPLQYISNYLSFFSLDFLFSFGDGIGRHQVQSFGELYHWQLPFFLSGIYFLLRERKSFLKYTTFLLFIAIPLVGAVAVPSPHSLRSLPLVIPCIIFVSVGILFLLHKIKKYQYKLAVITVISLLTIFEFFLYLQFYYVNYPQNNVIDWGSGFKQLVVTVEQMQKHYKHIVIDSTLQFAPIYFQFYDSSLQFTVVPPSWNKPNSWGKDSVLYVRPYFGRVPKDLLKNVYLPVTYPTIFAQLLDINK